MFFLVFEGIDGSGKSSLMKRLETYLVSKQQPVVMTREPGGTPLGDQIRALLLTPMDNAPTARTELLMYQASRAQHVDCVIRPAIENKKWVLCDRFIASSVAFQGGGRGISEDQVNWLNLFATNELKPHLTVLLDLSVEESKKRRQARSQVTGESEDRIESEKEEFHNRVRQSFLKQAAADADNWLVLDASLSPENLFDLLLENLRGRQWVV